MDKICIIGQSGTGKTNILNIINDIRVDNFGEMKYPFSEKSRIITKFKMRKEFIITREFSNKRLNDIQYEKLQNEQLENENTYFVKDSKEMDKLIWGKLTRNIKNYNYKRLDDSKEEEEELIKLSKKLGLQN